jgi:hypothetical protein
MRVLNLAGRSNPQFGASFLELEEILNALFSDDFNVVEDTELTQRATIGAHNKLSKRRV